MARNPELGSMVLTVRAEIPPFLVKTAMLAVQCDVALETGVVTTSFRAKSLFDSDVGHMFLVQNRSVSNV
jgi:hypothetical protein